MALAFVCYMENSHSLIIWDDNSPLFMSSYVSKLPFKRQNSQILRRPQDDNDGVVDMT
jgi:hypothetical protein